MKTKTIILVLLLTGFVNAGKNITMDKSPRTTFFSGIDAKFRINYFSEKRKLKVEINNNADSTAIVSVTNSRGTSIFTKVVEKKNNEIEFDLTVLECGTYNVMFISKEEIRIKKVEIK